MRNIHIVARSADDDTAENIDGGDDETCNRIAAHEFGCTVHGAEEGAFLFQLATAALRFLFIDQAGRQVGIDGHLLAGNGVEGEARAHFRDTRRALGDDEEVDDDENAENDQTDNEVAAHHELREAVDHMTGGKIAFIAVGENHACRRDIQRQSHHGGDQQHRWKGGKV